MEMCEEQNLPVEAGGPYDREAVFARRKEQLELRLAGGRRRDFVQRLAEKYGVSEDSIDMDWVHRNQWILDVAGTTDVVNLVGSALGSFVLNQEDRRKLINEIDKLVDGGELSKVAAINMKTRLRKEIDDADRIRLEILMKLGILQEAPKKMQIDKREVKVEAKIDWTEKIGELSEEARKEFYDLLDGVDFAEIGEEDDN